MALRNILRDNDQGLLKKSRVVTDFNKRLHILLDDMRETLISARGLGLAAPQVGVLRRVVLIVESADEPEPDDDDETSTLESADIDETTSDSDSAEDEEDMLDERIIELINPEILTTEGEQCGSEGCLSMPGLYGLVTRPQTVKVKAQDRFGQEFELEASDMTARAVCHEIDHLEGILFTSIAERMLSEEEMEEMRNRKDEETDDDLAEEAEGI